MGGLGAACVVLEFEGDVNADCADFAVEGLVVREIGRGGRRE